MVEQKKWQSWPLWLAFAALGVWVVKTFWGLDVSEPVDEFMNLLFPIVWGFGIVNNPNSHNTL